MDLPAAPAAAADEKSGSLGNVVVTAERKRADEIIVTASESRTQGLTETPPAATKIRPPPFEKTPESWYAYVEKLRAEGKVEEADRQLLRLEKAHPGWLERHQRDQPDR